MEESTPKLAQSARTAKQSALKIISEICDGSFDGMNIALYIVLERIRCDERRAGKTSNDDLPRQCWRKGWRPPGLDFPQSNDFDQPRSADGQGSLNPKGEVQLGFPSLVGDGNEHHGQYRIRRFEQPGSRVGRQSAFGLAQTGDSSGAYCYSGTSFADDSRPTDLPLSCAVYAIGDERIGRAGSSRGG